jgi:hypothetical protein
MRQKAYLDRTAAQLDGLRVQLERLRDQVFARSGRFNAEERRRLESLRDQYQHARWYADMLYDAEDWKHMRPEMDRLLEGLQRELDQARSDQQARA